MKQTILSIAGKPGLYQLVTQGRGMLIIESIGADKKRTTVGQRDRVTSLGDVSMYTDDEDKPLMEIFDNIKRQHQAQPVELNPKTASAAELADFMASALPNYDRDRVHQGDIRKLVQWYNILTRAGLTDFVDPEEQNEAPAAE